MNVTLGFSFKLKIPVIMQQRVKTHILSWWGIQVTGFKAAIFTTELSYSQADKSIV